MTARHTAEERQQAVAMFFVLNESTAETAEAYDVSDGTIRRWVREVHPDFVFRPSQSRDVCEKGHDMDATRKTSTEGHSFCSACRLEYQREWRAKRRKEKARERKKNKK